MGNTPWTIFDDGREVCSDGLSPTSRTRSMAERFSNKSRRVMCVNAFAGMQPDALHDLLFAVRAVIERAGERPTVLVQDMHSAYKMLTGRKWDGKPARGFEDDPDPIGSV